MSNHVILSTHGLRKSYGKRDNRFEALRGINISIKQGETVAIVGKSGSGKSTLMHLLALLDKPTKGTIELDSADTSKLRQGQLNRLRNKKFGFVFQSFFMNANDSVLNNVILPLKIAGLRSHRRRRQAMHALKTVGLESKAKNKANQNGGMDGPLGFSPLPCADMPGHHNIGAHGKADAQVYEAWQWAYRNKRRNFLGCWRRRGRLYDSLQRLYALRSPNRG